MFEVYIILDPSRKGKFCFGNYCFLYKPLYVGKGRVDQFRIYKRKNKTVSRSELSNYGISYDSINRIVNNNDYNTEYKSKLGTKYKLIESFFKFPNSDLKIFPNR